MLALLLRGDRFTAEEKARNFAYYEPLTVRDSSLSACVQAVVAAEVGHLELAYDYFGEAALMDLGDLEHNTARRPAHGLAGRLLDRRRRRLRRHAHPRRRAELRPRLPAALARLCFRIAAAAAACRSTITHSRVRYELRGDGAPLTSATRTSGSRSTASRSSAAGPCPDPGPEPAQPPGRAAGPPAAARR